jgi:hypothetical protein
MFGQTAIRRCPVAQLPAGAVSLVGISKMLACMCQITMVCFIIAIIYKHMLFIYYMK